MNKSTGSWRSSESASLNRMHAVGGQNLATLAMMFWAERPLGLLRSEQLQEIDLSWMEGQSVWHYRNRT